MTKKQGYPIVLCASRAEANSFENNPFAAFICTFPKKLSHIALKDYLDDLPTNDDGSAKRTIYGLRKVESLLIDAYGKDAVVVSHYNELDKFIGKDTKIVGISSMDPMGLAYVSTTYNSLIGFGGEPLNATEFKHPTLLFLFLLFKHKPIHNTNDWLPTPRFKSTGQPSLSGARVPGKYTKQNCRNNCRLMYFIRENLKKTLSR